MEGFGSRLLELRKELKLSQAELAEEAGVSQATISRLEGLDQPPSDVRLLTKIAKAVKCPLSDFMPEQAALREDHIRGLLRASDAAPDGSRKIDAALRRRPDADRVRLVDALTGLQLDLALGRANVVHAALLAGPESARFLARIERLERFRTGKPGDAGDRDTPPNVEARGSRSA